MFQKNDSRDGSVSRKELVSNVLFGLALFFKFFVYDVSIVPSCSMTPSFYTGDLVIVNKHCIRWSMLTIPWGGFFGFGRRGIQFGLPEPGTPCVFTKQNDPFTYYLKRLVAHAGDKVQIKEGFVLMNGKNVHVPGGVLHVNGQQVKMEFVKDTVLLNDENRNEKGQIFKITMQNGKSYLIYRNKDFGKGRIDNTVEYVVPKGHVWMQGDNHTGSIDSFTQSFLGPLPSDQLIASPVFILMNSNSRGTEESMIAWLVTLPIRILKYVWHINFDRFMMPADKI